MPNFDVHNGKSGKARALTAKRVKRLRNAGSVTAALPEKRREDKIRQPDLNSPTASLLSHQDPPTNAGGACQEDWEKLRLDFNAAAPNLNPIQRWSPKRQEAGRRRAKDQHFRDNWLVAAKNLSDSKFASEGNWASFDWLVKNDTNYLKALEGNYSNKKKRELPSDIVTWGAVDD